PRAGAGVRRVWSRTSPMRAIPRASSARAGTEMRASRPSPGRLVATQTQAATTITLRTICMNGGLGDITQAETRVSPVGRSDTSYLGSLNPFISVETCVLLVSVTSRQTDPIQSNLRPGVGFTPEQETVVPGPEEPIGGIQPQLPH